MNLPAPFYEHSQHVAIDLPGGHAVFTTRRGGFSSGPFSSLNLGRWTEDDPEAVERNRGLIAEQLGTPFAYGRQVHGTRVMRPASPTSDDREPAPADGQATSERGLAGLVLTADCLPIAVAGEGAVAMLHAGWRGLAGGIVLEGVRAVRELGASGELAAAIGPGAGGCCYEVGDDVRGAFRHYARIAIDGRKLDLKAVARAQLAEAGVDQVHDTRLCTICSDRSLFFSHRRDHGLTGRQAGIAWLS